MSMGMFASTETPAVIEAAITPLRLGTAVQPMTETIEEARACLSAGAAIIHHHHDFSASQDEGIRQMVGIQAGILEAFPDALMYSDYLNGTTLWEKNAHLAPLYDAGVLRMVPLDPSIVQIAKPDADGLPSDSIVAGMNFADADELVRFACKVGVPMAVSIYEPGDLRWARAYAQAGMFPAGSMIKFFFGGPYTIGKHTTPGIGFGLPPTKAALDIYLSMIDDVDMPWIAACLGGIILDTPLARYAFECGGSLRVGIEDTCGSSDMTNVESIEAARALAAEVGRPVLSGKAAKAFLRGSNSLLAA